MSSHLDRPQPYRDRRHTGAELAERLGISRAGAILSYWLCRGGMGFPPDEVARALDASLDVVLARKLGRPGYRELAMGAIAPGDVRVLNEEVVGPYGISAAAIDEVAREEQAEPDRREREYHDDRTPVELCDRIVLPIDDGLATGSTVEAAVQAVRAHGELSPR